MSKIICAIITFFILSSTCHALDEDKKMHMFASAPLGAFGVMACDLVKPEWPSWKKWLVGGSLGMIPGIAKELRDDKFDWQDIGADAIGSYGVGAALTITITIRW